MPGARDAAASAPARVPSGITAWRGERAAPLRTFLATETGGAALVASAAVVALVWANVAPRSYEHLWATHLAIVLGGHELSADLREWVNEGLMTLFFLVVGLEAKRELDLGELRERQRLLVPAFAAIGGMSVAGGIYLVLNVDGPGAVGWGAAVSTDTALALGALAMASGGRALRTRVFLLTVVVFDDLIALFIIAVAYSEDISVPALAVAAGLLVVLVALRGAGAWRGPLVAVTAVGLWAALATSGVDPVIAGLAVGLITGAYPPARTDLEHGTALTRSFREQPTPELAYSASAGLVSSLSANERLQYRLHPWTSRVVVPLFALANAGVHVDGDLLTAAMTSSVTLGIVAAYLVGKPIGVLLGAWVATWGRFGGMRPTITWPTVATAGVAAGAGFTVSLLVVSRAFEGQLADEAKVGILATAVLSPLLGRGALLLVGRISPDRRARQLGSRAEVLVDLADDVDLERDHVRGRVDAPVTLVQYGDFECPYCGAAAPMIDELLATLPDELRFVFRHLPLGDVHPNAQRAAEAAEAAGEQDAFWAMHDRLLRHQGELSPLKLREHAAALGLDLERFDDALRHRRFAARVSADVESADASGVTGTPTFFVNGRRHYGVYDVATLRQAVDAAARAVQST